MERICLTLLLSILSLNLFCQVHWTKYENNPVMLASPMGDWDEVLVSPSTVIYKDSTYHMWYWGGKPSGAYFFHIGYATSPDGINWTKDKVNNPVLSPGLEGAWDDGAINSPSVLFIDSIFHMWYTGYSPPVKLKIGHATSSDGINWTKDTDNNPVLAPGPNGSWDDSDVGDVRVVHDGSEYHMWYVGARNNTNIYQIGHATSSDGVSWTRDPQNPVIKLEAGSWEHNNMGYQMAVYDGTMFHMWYIGGERLYWGVGYATSVDGSTWIKNAGNPVFKGDPGSWDEQTIVSMAIIDSAQVKYKMWYSGKTSTYGEGHIGYAESDTRVPYLVVLSSETIFDSTNTLVAEIVLDGTIYIVPEGTSPVVDSMIKYNLASADALANTEVQIPLTDLSIGHYTVIAVSNDGFVSTNPFLLEVVPNAAPPELSLTKDTVVQEDAIVATSDKDGTIFLVNENTPADLTQIFYPVYFRDSLKVKANIPVEFPTDGLSVKDYWLYAVDVYDQISEANTVTVMQGVGVEENTSDMIRIYPIPARELIIIEATKPGQKSIEIASLNGQLIYNSKMDGNRKQIDLSSFQKGVYFITIRSEDLVTTRKIIKY